ncbi:MAG: hypothetical protein ACREKL_11570, partial [Chthoniobacterales bacterium]
MTFEYVILPEHRCIAIRYTGTITLPDVIASTKELWADPLYDKTYNGITDLSRATAGGSVEEIAPLVDFYKHPETSTGRWAVIFTEPKFTALGLLFKSSSYAKPWIELFTSWE